jgi:excisionase family DNA binding protein
MTTLSLDHHVQHRKYGTRSSNSSVPISPGSAKSFVAWSAGSALTRSRQNLESLRSASSGTTRARCKRSPTLSYLQRQQLLWWLYERFSTGRRQPAARYRRLRELLRIDSDEGIDLQTAATLQKRLSADDIAAHLGVTKDTVYTWITDKHMPAHKLGRLWKFQATEVDDWVRSGGAITGTVGDESNVL